MTNCCLFHEHCVLCIDAVSSSDDIMLNPRLTFCVNARLWPHADMCTWAPSFWSQGILRILTWGPSGTAARLQGSRDSIWGTKGLSQLRPRCIGAERPSTHMQSIYLSSVE